MEAGHVDTAAYVRLWSGDLQGALQLAAEKGELNDHLLSLAPMGNDSFSHVPTVGCGVGNLTSAVFTPSGGFELWSRTAEAFVKQLCVQEQYLKAASHLLSLGKVYEAVALLHSHKLYRFARASAALLLVVLVQC